MPAFADISYGLNVRAGIVGHGLHPFLNALISSDIDSATVSAELVDSDTIGAELIDLATITAELVDLETVAAGIVDSASTSAELVDLATVSVDDAEHGG